MIVETTNTKHNTLTETQPINYLSNYSNNYNNISQNYYSNINAFKHTNAKNNFNENNVIPHESIGADIIHVYKNIFDECDMWKPQTTLIVGYSMLYGLEESR